jgi:hypothetical protein
MATLLLEPLQSLPRAGLARTADWAIATVWIFNVWGLADLLFAFYKGARVNLEPGALGAGFYNSSRTGPIGVTRSHIRAVDEK